MEKRRKLREGMYLILQRLERDDYVPATGESHSVRELVERFVAVGIAHYTRGWRPRGN